MNDERPVASLAMIAVVAIIVALVILVFFALGYVLRPAVPVDRGCRRRADGIV